MTRDSQRKFTLEEIHRILPDLEIRIARFLEKKAAYARMHDHLLMEELLQDIESRQGDAVSGSLADDEAGKLEITVSELEREIKEMRRLGCLLQDLENGWVDFPALQQSQPIFFCWKRGDATVRFYRLSGTASSERKPL